MLVVTNLVNLVPDRLWTKPMVLATTELGTGLICTVASIFIYLFIYLFIHYSVNYCNYKL